MFFISWTFSSALAPPRFQVDGAAGSIWKPTDRQDEDDQEGVGSRSEQLFREEREEKRAKFGLRKDLSERFPNGFAEWGALYDAAVEAAIASFVYRQTSWPGELSVLTWSTVRLSLSLFDLFRLLTAQPLHFVRSTEEAATHRVSAFNWS